MKETDSPFRPVSISGKQRVKDIVGPIGYVRPSLL